MFDLIDFHLVTRRLALKYDVQFPEKKKNEEHEGEGKGKGKSALSVEEKVRTLMMGRLRANGDVLGRWPEVCMIVLV